LHDRSTLVFVQEGLLGGTNFEKISMPRMPPYYLNFVGNAEASRRLSRTRSRPFTAICACVSFTVEFDTRRFRLSFSSTRFETSCNPWRRRSQTWRSTVDDDQKQRSLIPACALARLWRRSQLVILNHVLAPQYAVVRG
jgi:hypothetical protein